MKNFLPELSFQVHRASFVYFDTLKLINKCTRQMCFSDENRRNSVFMSIDPGANRLKIRASIFVTSAAIVLSSLAAFAVEREPLTPQFYIDQVFKFLFSVFFVVNLTLLRLGTGCNATQDDAGSLALHRGFIPRLAIHSSFCESLSYHFQCIFGIVDETSLLSCCTAKLVVCLITAIRAGSRQQGVPGMVALYRAGGALSLPKRTKWLSSIESVRCIKICSEPEAPRVPR